MSDGLGTGLESSSVSEMEVNGFKVRTTVEKIAEAEKSKELLLDILEEQALGGGRVINAARAAATPCKCYKIDTDEMCFSPGIIGSISSKKNPEQIREYCAVGKEYLLDGMQRRINEFRKAVSEAHERWKGRNGTLPEWWEEISRSMKEHKIEL